MKRLFTSLTKYVNGLKIKNQLLMTYFVAVLIPVLLLGGYLLVNTRNLVMQQQISDTKAENVRIENSLKQLTDIIYSISNNIYFDGDIRNLISKKYDGVMDFTDSARNYSQLDTYIYYYNQISSIKIYADNNTIYDSAHYMRATNEVKNSDWYKKAIKSWGIMWMTTLDTQGQPTLSLVRRMPKPIGAVDAVLVINISRNYLYQLEKDSSQKTMAAAFGRKIFLSNSFDDYGKRLDVSTSDKNVSDVGYMKIDGKKVLTVYDTLNMETSKDTIAILTINSAALERGNKVTFICCLILLVSMIFPFIIIMYFINVFSSRINCLRSEMNGVSKGNLEVSGSPGGNDEISELYSDLNIMIDRIKNLLNDAYMEKLMKERMINSQQKIEFKMLASQINPHFLYNTLETIRMKLICNGDRETANVIKILGKTIRRMLEVKDETVTLDSELEYIRYYLDIQRFRFGDRINYEINIDSGISTKQYYILPLLLQPIVENAFVHGLEDKEGGGKITVDINKEDGKLVILVQDDGIGIPPEKCRKLNAEISNMDNTSIKNSIGLCNVHHRIVLYYGSEYGINIVSNPGTGTKVYINLPLDSEGMMDYESTDHRR